MKRLTMLALFAALLTIGSTPVFAADAQPDGKADENVNSSINTSRTAATLDLSWLSINGGGISYGSGGTRRIGYSVGQSLAGEGSGGTRKVGIGFWYGSTRVCGAAKGDMNGVGGITPADAVLMLNCIFLGIGTSTVGGDCNLCYSDMNCVGGLTPADAVAQLNYVFLGISPPCL